ncbi:MAG: OmpW family outer membrane protein [Thermoanaerobaculia bacterium]|nr:OmpW family outer membrane protein [Thermoanaerobaculia bacterium]
MKRLTLTILLLSLSLPLQARTLDITARYSWIDLSGDTTLENTDPEDIDDVDIEFDSETGYGLAVNLFIGNRLSLEASASRFEPEAAATSNNPAIVAGALDNLEVVPLTAVLQLHLFPESTFDPYVGAGIGYVLFDDIEDREDFEQIDIERIDLEDDYGLVFNLGFSWDLMPGLALNVDGKYMPLDSAATVVFLTGPAEETSFEVNPLILSAGVSIQF